MGLIELLLTGVGLSMDAFAVSICKGLCMRRVNYRHTLIIALFFPDFGEVWMFSVLGIFFISSAIYRMARLRNERTALEEAKAEMEENEKQMKAYREDKTPVFHKTGEE